MASKFETRFLGKAVPKLMAQFAHEIDFILDDLSELRFSAMVDIDQIPSSGEDFVEVDGRLTIKTADIARRVAEYDVLTLVRYKDQLYDVYSKSPDHCGLTVFNIRRKASEQAETNIYDLNGTQAKWHVP